MSHRRSTARFLAAGCLLITLFFFVVPFHGAQAQTSQTPELFYNEIQTVYLTNLERRKANLPPLRWNRELSEAARGFAQDVVTNLPAGYCGHTDSQGRNPGARMRDAGFTNLGMWAENAVCGYATPSSAVRAWMESPSHRANILGSDFREIGVGYARDASGRGYVVQDLTVDKLFAPVIIDDEAPSTTTPEVGLYIYNQVTSDGVTGMGETLEIMISNTPDFANASWQPYSAEVDWQLEPGEGWRTVYVKARDRLGRTTVVHDSIYLGPELSQEQITFAGASQVESGFTLETVDVAGWSQVQFSLGWILDDSDPTFQLHTGKGERVNDPAAIGGTALRMDGNSPVAYASGWAGAPISGVPMTAYFRLKAGANSGEQEVARLTVRNQSKEYGPLILRAADFNAPGEYQEFAIAFDFSGSSDLVTFEFERSGAVEIYADAVTLYATPAAATAPLQWQAPGGYQRSRGVVARLLDGAGAFSAPIEVYPDTGQLIVTGGNAPAKPRLDVTPQAIWLDVQTDEQPAMATVTVACQECAIAQWQASSDESWMALMASEDTLEIRCKTDGLEEGFYYGQIVVSVPGMDELEPVTVEVTLAVGGLDKLLPHKVYLPAVTQ